jgi:hypothetical protein
MPDYRKGEKVRYKPVGGMPLLFTKPTQEDS